MGGVIKAKPHQELLSLGNSRSDFIRFVGWWSDVQLLGKENIFYVSLFLPHANASHVHTQHTMYIFYLKSLKLNTQQCFSLEFHFRNANALGPDTLWFISSFIFAHICLCPCVCLLLIPPFFQPVCLSWDLGLPHLPLSAPNTHTHTRLCACIYTKHMRSLVAGENIQLRSPLRFLMLPSPCYCQLCWGPVIQSVHDHAQRSLLLQYRQSARCLSWTLNTVVVHYWET